MLKRFLDGADAALLQLVQLLEATGYRFVTPTPVTHALVRRRRGCDWATDLRDVFGWSLPFRDGVVAPDLVEAMATAGILLGCDGGHRSAIRVSTLDEMAFVHSAFPTAEADAVFFGPDTYRFARAIMQHRTAANADRVARAVDVGSGAGPGAVVIAKHWPRAEVVGVDVNAAALRMARVNAAAADVTVGFVESDLLSAVTGSFDLIVANPPYLVDAGERTYRHGGGPLGAGLSLDILDSAMERLTSGGTLLLYTGSVIVAGIDAFGLEAQSRLAGRNVSWTYEEVDPDVFGEELGQGAYAEADRIAAVLLTATKQD